MGDRTAFFYGTLMAREVLNRVIYGVSKPLPSSPQYTLSLSLKISPALLPSYCRHKVQHADYPGIIPDASREVRGTYVTGLTEGDIWRLDRFEGSEYDRQDVVITLLSEEADGRAVETEGKAEERRTQTYVYTAGEERLEKKEWDYEVFRREKMHRWADASDEYRDVDEAVNDQEEGGHDPTGGRGVRPQGSKKQEEEKLRSAV
ncbi:unnamed protein product [Diplocarpon coronariae]